MSRAFSNNAPSKKIQIQHDRFSFTNRGSCFIELASEQQAQEAVQKLNGKKFMDSKLAVTPIKEDFIWGGSPNSPENVTNERYFLDEGNQAAEAIRPILEGRRYILKVATPGWASKDQSENQNQVARRLIAEHFGPFGLEAVGQLSVFYGDHKSHPRMLCMIDFKTQEGAERAVAALDNTEIEGRLTQLVVSRPAPWRADQMGKVDKSLLKALEEKGLLDEPVREDKFRTKRYPESKGSRKQS
jgi:RNA recognition motif-containing protein